MSEKPTITPDHLTFNTKVTAVALDLAEQAKQFVSDHARPSPSEAAVFIVDECAKTSLDFYHKNRSHSHPFPGMIAGSDGFVLREVEAAEEILQRDPLDFTFPGRVIGLELLYGDSLVRPSSRWKAYLYAVPETPPVLIAKDYMYHKLDRRLHHTMLAAVGIAMDKAPSGDIHFPSGDELRLILGGLVKVGAEIDYKCLMDFCHIKATGEYNHLSAEAAWFVDQKRRLPGWVSE